MVEKYLPQCIDSIINQTYQELEIILVDDGSPDNCGFICEEYAQKDKRIKVFHKKHGGLADARNYGLSKATGEYLGFVDSDDWIEPDMYETLLAAAEDNKAGIVNCGHYFEYPKRSVNSKIGKRFSNCIDLCKALIYGEVSAVVWNKLFHKSCFSDIAFPNGHVFEDTAIMHKLFLKEVTIETVTKPLYHYRNIRKGKITESRTMENLIDYWMVHKSRYDFFMNDARFNSDIKFMDKLRYLCANAVARTWCWCYGNTEQERERYDTEMKEIHGFCVQNFPVCGLKDWPFHLRAALFIGRFNNNFVFALLYYMLRGYKLVKHGIRVE